MYYVSAQGVDERMINVHYYYYHGEPTLRAGAVRPQADLVRGPPVQDMPPTGLHVGRGVRLMSSAGTP